MDEGIIEELPQVIVEGVDYDANNPAHVAQWVANDRPNLSGRDADGNPWRPTVTKRLDEDGKYVVFVDSPARDPNKAPQPILERGEFKSLRAQLDASGRTVAETQAILGALLDKLAGI